MVDSGSPSRPSTPADIDEHVSDNMTPAPSLLSRPTMPVLLEPPSPHPPMIPPSAMSRSTPAPPPITVPPPSSSPMIHLPPAKTAPLSPAALWRTSTKEDDLDLDPDPHYLATPVQRSYFVHLSELFEKKAQERIAAAEDVKKERRMSRVLAALRRASVIVTGVLAYT
ncbi:hypothetical protein JCM10295v2_001241 [Rhodotorula toruloides]